MKNTRELSGALVLLLITAARPAAAHFTLTKPTSWLKEDPAALGGGGPQKGSPCGPGGLDDVKPIPVSGAVTDFHVGETIEVTWTDTVAHPGHFRIALAANRGDLKNPTIVQDTSCNYDESKVPMTASGNVLADGIFFRSRSGFTAKEGKMFSYMVTLPSQPCDKCTLQVMQIMENDIQALSNCYYFHCADIRILPAGQTSGTGGSTGAGGSNAGAGGFALGGATGNGGTGMGGTLGFAGTASSAGGLLPGSGSGGFVPGSGASGGPGTAGTVPATGAPGAAGSGAGGEAYAAGGGLNGSAAPAEQDGSCAIAGYPRRKRGPFEPFDAGTWLAAFLVTAARLRRNTRKSGARAN
jgi:hypothetical protein